VSQVGSVAKAALSRERGSLVERSGNVQGARTRRAQNMTGVTLLLRTIAQTLSAVGLRYVSAAQRKQLT